MKARLVSKIFIPFFCSLIFVLPILAQEKPIVVEFAQISVKSNETKVRKLTETLEKFISRLENEPVTTKGYIDVPVNTDLGKKIKLFVSESSIIESRIMFWGNLKHPELYRYPFGINLYLVPQGTEVPYSCILEPCFCPTLAVDVQKETGNRNNFLLFRAETEGGEKGNIITFNWKVSAGKIIEGQGTRTIKVDAEGAKEIIATVEIGGVCEVCNREASFSTKIQ